MANRADRQNAALCAPLRASLAVALALGTLLLGGCSDGPAPMAQSDDAKADPPGAALPLSIGGQVQAEGGDTRDVAINCAVALGITAERLATMSSNPRSAEILLIGQARDYFASQSNAETAADENAAGSAEAAIARRRSEKSNETTEQAQLAIACLRRYGDEVGAAG